MLRIRSPLRSGAIGAARIHRFHFAWGRAEDGWWLVVVGGASVSYGPYDSLAEVEAAVLRVKRQWDPRIAELGGRFLVAGPTEWLVLLPRSVPGSALLCPP